MQGNPNSATKSSSRVTRQTSTVKDTALFSQGKGKAKARPAEKPLAVKQEEARKERELLQAAKEARDAQRKDHPKNVHFTMPSFAEPAIVDQARDVLDVMGLIEFVEREWKVKSLPTLLEYQAYLLHGSDASSRMTKWRITQSLISDVYSLPTGKVTVDAMKKEDFASTLFNVKATASEFPLDSVKEEEIEFQAVVQVLGPILNAEKGNVLKKGAANALAYSYLRATERLDAEQDQGDINWLAHYTEKVSGWAQLCKPRSKTPFGVNLYHILEYKDLLLATEQSLTELTDSEDEEQTDEGRTGQKAGRAPRALGALGQGAPGAPGAPRAPPESAPRAPGAPGAPAPYLL